jgi:hypothetical protein
MYSETGSGAPIVIRTVSRPKRVAFLVDPARADREVLNEIIRCNLAMWGGGFNVIIPTDGTDIASTWWNLLALVDPDIVYSLVPLSNALFWRIYRCIVPAKIVETGPNDGTTAGGRHLIRTSEINALGIECIPRFAWTRRGPLSEPRFFYIRDSWSDQLHSTFALLNFGALPGIVRIEEAYRDFPHEVVELEASTAKDLLRRLTEHPIPPVLPLDICKMFVPERHYLKSPSPEFQLIIGDSPLDVIYAWNRSSFSSPVWCRDTFWLGEDLSEDEEILSLVVAWVRERFLGSVQHPRGVVVSYSAPHEHLSSLASQMSEKLHCHFETVQLTADRFPCPELGSLLDFPMDHVEQVPLSGNEGLVGFQRPPFLSQDYRYQSAWMVDLEIQFYPERYGYTNVRPKWRLPKRLGLAPKFLKPFRLCRIVDGGLPSAEVTDQESRVGIRIPSDFEIIGACCFEHHHTNLRHEHLGPTPYFSHVDVSDKGGYLSGVLQLFGDPLGNLWRAGRFFNDPFWRDVLLQLAMLPTDVRAATWTYERLKNHFNQLRSRFGQLYPGERFRDEKEDELHYLLERKVFFQGAELQCPWCGTRAWYIVDDLKSDMRCSGCYAEFSLQSAPEWSFKLNELVRNALSRYGILPVLETLYKLAFHHLLGFGDGMFLFTPSLDIFPKNDQNCFTDLDIIAVANGRFIVGEVKTSPEGFRGQFPKLKVIATELLPDVILLTARGNNWPEDIEAEIRKLEEELTPLGIRVFRRVLTWDC